MLTEFVSNDHKKTRNWYHIHVQSHTWLLVILSRLIKNLTWQRERKRRWIHSHREKEILLWFHDMSYWKVFPCLGIHTWQVRRCAPAASDGSMVSRTLNEALQKQMAREHSEKLESSPWQTLWFAVFLRFACIGGLQYCKQPWISGLRCKCRNWKTWKWIKAQLIISSCSFFSVHKITVNKSRQWSSFPGNL